MLNPGENHCSPDSTRGGLARVAFLVRLFQISAAVGRFRKPMSWVSAWREKTPVCIYSCVLFSEATEGVCLCGNLGGGRLRFEKRLFPRSLKRKQCVRSQRKRRREESYLSSARRPNIC
jgi:hypothetical protein